MYKFFAYLGRMKYIKRWSLMRSIREENIMEHSHQVAVIAHALALINNKVYGGNVDVKTVVLLAQYHEVGEVITGDLPTPIKYFNPEIKSAYKDLEKDASEKLINMLPGSNTTGYFSMVSAGGVCILSLPLDILPTKPLVLCFIHSHCLREFTKRCSMLRYWEAYFNDTSFGIYNLMSAYLH